MKSIATFFLLILVSTFMSAQILQEDFTGYTVGANLDGQGRWKFGATTGQLHLKVQNTTPLTYPGYNMGGGNYVVMGDTCTTACREADTMATPIASYPGTTFYFSFLLRVDSAHHHDATTTQALGYFMSLGNATGSTSSLAPKLYADSNADGTTYVLGLSKSSTSISTGIVWGTTALAYHTTHLIVVRYTFNTAGTAFPANVDDQAWLWVDLTDPSEPDPLGAECASWSTSDPDTTGMFPAKDKDFDGFGAIAGGVGSFIWHNRNWTNPKIEFDGLSIGQAAASADAWTNLNPGPLPVQMTTVSATANRLNAQLHWSTATEVNNYGFDIERKTSANSWTKVGFVAGEGTSNAAHTYAYTDEVGQAGLYEYRIKQIDKDGTFKYSKSTQVEVGLVAKELSLGANYPNPFNPSTNIEFSVPNDGRAVLKVYNVLGQEVATLFNGNAIAGQLNKATFNASRLPSGVYFSRMEFGGTAIVRKMLLVK